MKLEDYQLISTTEWLELENPQFEGQTRVVNNIYYMCWSCDGKYYKTENLLIPEEYLTR